VDGSEMMLTPEESMRHQNNIGADVMMALDDVVSSMETDSARVKEASERTIRWIDRCIKAHLKPEKQNLFGILQGGLDPVLRRINALEMMKRDAQLPGYAIGGLAGGEDKAFFWRVIHQCTTLLPNHKPRYCMGVGYPLDLVVCVALGVDMFDCVWPSRTARFGTAIVPEGLLQLRHAQYKEDTTPISKDCDCDACLHFTRAYFHAIATKEPSSCHLLTMHNIRYQMRLMEGMGKALREGTFPEFVNSFLKKQFPEGDWPDWVQEALMAAGIETGRKSSYSVSKDPYFIAAQHEQA
jgi:queuine tRNA-ribosyltransferase